MPASANPTDRFLLSCCAPDGAPLTASPTTLDWERLERVARHHGVLPLVARRLAQTPLGDASASRRIVAHGHANHLRNQYLTAQLVELLAAMRRASIEVITIKGPVLAQIAYGDPGLRAFSDLDLLVRRPRLGAAARLLEELGFTPDLYDEAAVASGFFDAVETNFQRGDGLVNIDLHWALSPAHFRFGPDDDDLWRRAIEMPLGDARVRTLGHEDHLLYLAVHASRHGWATLGNVCDIAYLIHAVSLDWPALMARASATGCSRMVAVGLLLAHDLLGVAPPAAVLVTARSDRRAVALAARIETALIGDEAPGERPGQSLGAITGLRDRLRYVLARGFAPTLVDLRWCPLPRRYYPAYYLLRPIRLGVALARRVRGS